MSRDYDIICQLIKDEALVTVDRDQYNNNFLELSEPELGSKSGYAIKILRPPIDTIAIKSDLFPPPKHIFKNTRGVNKRSDYVVISRSQTKDWIIYIEMKSGNHDLESEIIQQLQGSICFIDYCRSIGRIFFKEPKFLDGGKYRQRFIAFKNIRLSTKRRTAYLRISTPHDSPENMLKISYPPPKSIWFNKLIA